MTAPFSTCPDSLETTVPYKFFTYFFLLTRPVSRQFGILHNVRCQSYLSVISEWRRVDRVKRLLRDWMLSCDRTWHAVRRWRWNVAAWSLSRCTSDQPNVRGVRLQAARRHWCPDVQRCKPAAKLTSRPLPTPCHGSPPVFPVFRRVFRHCKVCRQNAQFDLQIQFWASVPYRFCSKNVSG